MKINNLIEWLAKISAIIALIVSVISLNNTIRSLNSTIYLSKVSDLISLVLNKSISDDILMFIPKMQSDIKQSKVMHNDELVKMMALLKLRIENTSISNIDLTGIIIKSENNNYRIKNVKMSQIVLDKALFENCELLNWRIQNTSLNKSVLVDIRYDYGGLYHVNAENIFIFNVLFAHAPFNNVTIDSSKFINVTFKDMVISESEFKNCEFVDCKFIRCHIMSEFKFTKIKNCYFKDTYIKNNNYTSVRLYKNTYINTFIINSAIDNNTLFVDCDMRDKSYIVNMNYKKSHPNKIYIQNNTIKLKEML